MTSLKARRAAYGGLKISRLVAPRATNLHAEEALRDPCRSRGQQPPSPHFISIGSRAHVNLNEKNKQNARVMRRADLT
jgi:hypothetical protein